MIKRLQRMSFSLTRLTLDENLGSQYEVVQGVQLQMQAILGPEYPNTAFMVYSPTLG